VGQPYDVLPNPGRSSPAASHFTPGEKRVLTELAASLVRMAREAGAETRRVTIGSLSFELRESDTEEVLFIRKTVAS
jgi:hypothetical protein